MDITIRDWTLTHWWVRPTVKLWFDFYHKSVTYSGTGHINWEKPIIFAPSHQNAFTDALCLILPARYTNDRFIYPLIRADAFGKSKVMDWILTAFHMLPVYRPRDNVNLKKENESVFAHCYEILRKNRNLLVHPEGNCIPKKTVRPFKKGLARIAFGAEEKYDFNLGVQIVPVGINYGKITEARKGIHIRYGEPLAVADYKKQYRDHDRRAITELTRNVEKGVREVTVDFGTGSNYHITERLVRLKKSLRPRLGYTLAYTEDEMEAEQQFSRELEKVKQEAPDIFEEIEESFCEINAILSEKKLNTNQPLVETISPGRFYLEAIGYLLLSPVFFYGWLNNIMPWFAIHKMADSVNKDQFKSSARMVSGMLIFPACYILQGGIAGWLSGSLFWTIAYLFSLPFSGMLSLNLFERWTQWKQQFRLKKMPEKEKTKLNGLINQLFEKLSPDSDSLSNPAQS